MEKFPSVYSWLFRSSQGGSNEDKPCEAASGNINSPSWLPTLYYTRSQYTPDYTQGFTFSALDHYRYNIFLDALTVQYSPVQCFIFWYRNHQTLSLFHGPCSDTIWPETCLSQCWESLFLLIIHCRPSTNSEVEVTQSILMWVFSQLSIAIETFNRGLTSFGQDPALFFILNLNKEIQPTR